MGCGSSVKKDDKVRLSITQDQVRSSREELRDKDRLVQQHTDDLIEAGKAHAQESQERARLERELEATKHRNNQVLDEERVALQDELDQRWRACLEDAERDRMAQLEADAPFSPGVARRTEECAERRSYVELAEVASRRLIGDEEERAARARDELREALEEVQVAQRERDLEAEAAAATREVYLAERRAAQAAGEHLSAEVRTRRCETEALEDSHRGLEGQTKSLQYELSRVVYTVGQRDHELKVKGQELQEVRQSLTCIQEEMDQVNEHLQEQCSRVQRVESSLRLSRGLGEKVQGLRGMLQESHDALAQLCGLLEQERTRREQCTQGLKQQKVRTELLLQLLHHFKSRTQDLAPHALLATRQGAHIDETGAMAFPEVFPADSAGGGNFARGPEAAAWYPPFLNPAGGHFAP